MVVLVERDLGVGIRTDQVGEQPAVVRLLEEAVAEDQWVRQDDHRADPDSLHVSGGQTVGGPKKGNLRRRRVEGHEITTAADRRHTVDHRHGAVRRPDSTKAETGDAKDAVELWISWLGGVDEGAAARPDPLA